MIAPKRLGLKVDAPVMLFRNINDKFVNGLVWRVLDIEEDSIKVAFKFDGTIQVLNMTRCAFTKYDPKTRKCIAKRYQFPLKLVYAYTIHTSQGMTLPYCIVDCRHAGNPGQIGVAIGRVQSVANANELEQTTSANESEQTANAIESEQTANANESEKTTSESKQTANANESEKTTSESEQTANANESEKTTSESLPTANETEQTASEQISDDNTAREKTGKFK